MPARKTNSGVEDAHAKEDFEEDNRVYKFVKDEIVWAKMKFFSAWPAKVRNQIIINI